MTTDAAAILGKGGPTKSENNETGCKAGRSEGHCGSSSSFGFRVAEPMLTHQHRSTVGLPERQTGIHP
jgi:hypothetical protein